MKLEKLVEDLQKFITMGLGNCEVFFSNTISDSQDHLIKQTICLYKGPPMDDSKIMLLAKKIKKGE